MIVTLCAMLALAQEPATQTAAKPATAGALFTQVLQHYYDVKSLSGRIHLTQSARGATVVIDTDIAFDQPNRLLIRQTQSGGSAKQWLTVSDGEHFAYDRPEGTLGPDRFRENVKQRAGEQTVREMYGTAAISLGDRSPVLDIVFGRRVDLVELKAHIKSVRFGTKTTIRGTEANVVEGDYAEDPGKEPTGTFSMAVTDAGDILRLAIKNRYTFLAPQQESVEVTSVWDVDVKYNSVNNPSIYGRV